MDETWFEHALHSVAIRGRHSFTDGDWVEAPHISDTGIRLIQTGNIGVGRFIDRSRKYVSQSSFEALGCKEVYPGDLLICRLAEPVGRACFAPDLGERMITSVDVTILRIDQERFDPFFLSSYINNPEFLRECELLSGGTTRKRISRTSLGSRSFRAPGLRQQKRIAKILSTVDEAIEHTEALIAKTQQIKTGLMHDLFTRGVTADGQLRPPREEAPQLYKESPLGWIPKGWDTVLLDDISVRGSGHTPNKNHPEYWNGAIKWVSLADSWRLDRVHISDTDHKISQAGIENSSAVLHPAGIVVLSRDAGVGKSAVTTTEMAVSQHFMCWRCGPRLHNYYLYYWLQHRKWEFENIATGSTIPTIGLRFFRHYRINVPVQVAEQSRIAESILAAEEQVSTLERDLWKLRCLRAGLMQDLLTGRIAVAVESSREPREVAANV